MRLVFYFIILLSIYHLSTSNEIECTTDDDCTKGEVESEFCTDTGICAEGNSFKCPENMHYHPCGPSCPRTCTDVLNPNPNTVKSCVAMCVPRCVCNDDYVLNENTDDCIPETKCQKEEANEKGIHKRAIVQNQNVTMECSENAEFSDCTNLCPEFSCGSLLQINGCFSLRCGPPGCRCKDGHVLKAGGNITDGCVNIETCPDFASIQKSIKKRDSGTEKPQDTRCPKNAEYRECTNTCGEKHCGNIFVWKRTISLRCGPAGCQCREGHVRLTDSSESACVRREACPKRFRRFLKNVNANT